MIASGIDPVLLQPVAEQVIFRSAVLPGERVTVRTKRVGVDGTDAVVLKHYLETERGPAAEATSIRTLAEGNGAALISTIDTLVQNDEDDMLFDMLRRGLDQGPDGQTEAPITTMLDAFIPVISIAPNACTAEHEPWSPNGLDSVIQSIVGFMRDPEHGLPSLFDTLEAFVASDTGP